ncbi:hypothetical protein Plhal304r1_c006g0023761 [Plasmopara halstedii]
MNMSIIPQGHFVTALTFSQAIRDFLYSKATPSEKNKLTAKRGAAYHAGKYTVLLADSKTGSAIRPPRPFYHCRFLDLQQRGNAVHGDHQMVQSLKI